MAKRRDITVDPWITACVSVTGTSHRKSGISCQDASAVKVNSTGEWVAIVASDGAGTADRAQEGSALVADIFLKSLLTIAAELSSRQPGHWINDLVIEKVLEVRQLLRDRAKSDNISTFNCTLVSCLLGPSGGFAIHIGDGAVFGGINNLAESAAGSTKGSDFFISSPENGAYANETYFITEGDWIKHLRIMPLPRLDWVFACTDGGTALALETDKIPKEGFIFPVLQQILSKPTLAERNSALRDILINPEADKATGDDKTIILACRESQISQIRPAVRTLSEGDNKSKQHPTDAEPIQNQSTFPKAKVSKPKRWFLPWLSLTWGLVLLFLGLMLAIVTTAFLLDYKIFSITQLKNIFSSAPNVPGVVSEPKLEKDSDNLETTDRPQPINNSNTTEPTVNQSIPASEQTNTATVKNIAKASQPKSSDVSGIPNPTDRQVNKESKALLERKGETIPQQILVDKNEASKKKSDKKEFKGIEP